MHILTQQELWDILEEWKKALRPFAERYQGLSILGRRSAKVDIKTCLLKDAEAVLAEFDKKSGGQ